MKILECTILHELEEESKLRISAKILAELFSAKCFCCRDYFHRISENLAEIISTKVFPPNVLVSSVSSFTKTLRESYF